MKKNFSKPSLLMLLFLAAPLFVQAQGISDSIHNLNDVLLKLFKEMLPLCKKMMDIGRAIGGFGALWYIGYRVWKHIAQAEPIDFYPLLRPFAIGLAIVMFPSVLALINGVLQPIVDTTREMSKDSQKAIIWNIEQQEKALQTAPPVATFPQGADDLEKYEQPETEEEGGLLSGLKSAFSLFNLKSMFKVFIMELVQIIYSAAALCINTIRTFYLIVLAILGPLVFGLSIFDGFQQTLSNWFARYINIFMWLPVANVFGAITSKILENMSNMDQNFFSSVAYIIFMIISIVGYTTVPTVAGYIIQAGGGEQDTLLHKVNTMTAAAGKAAVSAL